MNKSQGFTLIELLVVIIIIGILAAIAVPVYLNQRQKALEGTMKQDLRNLAMEMETYYADKHEYPRAITRAEVLGALPGSPGADFAANGQVVHASPGNTLYAETAPGFEADQPAGTYCLYVTNQNSSYAWKALTYDSRWGGQLPRDELCEAAFE